MSYALCPGALQIRFVSIGLTKYGGYSRLELGLDFVLLLVSEPSDLPTSASGPFDVCPRLFFRAFSSIRICLSIDSRSFLFVRRSPSSFPILDFISALSICQAFRSRSCLCHSICKKRITPMNARSQLLLPKILGAEGLCPSAPIKVSHAHLEACILFLATDHHSHRPRCCRQGFLRFQDPYL